MVIATAVLTYLIYWLRPVLVPFVVALFVVSGITPVLEVLESRLSVNRLIAAAITFLSGLLALILLGLSIWLSVLQMAQQGDAYRSRVSELVRTVEGWFDWDSTDNPAADQGELAAQGTAASTLEDFRRTLDRFVQDGLKRLSGELFQLASTSLVVLIYVFFLLLGTTGGMTAEPPIREIDQQVRSYLFMKTIISIFTGGAFGLALWLFGVPMSLTFGVLAFLLNYIPNIGPLVASVLPIPFIILHPDGSLLWMTAAISITVAIQVISGNVIEPKWMGDSADLHPVVILLGLMFWGMMWGITGMFLATPITAGIKIVLERLDSTRRVAELMAGRWAAFSDEHR